MSNQQKRQTLDTIEQADLLLISMKGQMDMAQERAERSTQPIEFNDVLHMAIIMKTLIDSVRACLDEAAQCIVQATETA